MKTPLPVMLGVVALTLCSLLGADLAHAQDEDFEPDVLTVLEDANELARKRRYKQAIPKYKKVLQMEPTLYPSVYYNLAEIKRFQNDCVEAVMLYQRYLVLVPKTRDKVAIDKSVAGCQKAMGPLSKLSVKVAAEEEPTIEINGIPLARAKKLELELKPGKYDIKISAIDHKVYKGQAEVKADEEAKVEVTLELKQFEGELEIAANIEGADVYVDGKSIGKTPLKPLKVGAGKRFIEVKKPGYYRWVRNVVVPRNDVMTVNIKLEKEGEE